MKRAAVALSLLLVAAWGCSSGEEAPDFGEQEFNSDSFGDSGNNNSYFDETGDASTPTNNSGSDASTTDSDAGSGTESDASSGCEPDPAEPDNGAATATSLGEFSDSQKTTQELTIHSLHDASDEDWFLLEVDDTFDLSNPEPEVRVTGLGANDTYEVAAWYTCDSGGGVECVDGTADDTFGPGCAASGSGEEGVLMELKSKCDGTSEDGTMLVRIRALQHSGSCAPYVVRFRVD